MYHFVYKVTNKINNKIYIGVHSTNNLDDGYIGCGCHSNSIRNTNTRSPLPKAFLKYGIENFTLKILEFFNNRKEAYKNESELVNDEWVKNPNTYNITKGGRGGFRYDKSGKNNPNYGKHLSDDIKEKISKSVSEAHKKGKFTYKPLSQETKNKISRANKGKKRSEEEKKKRSLQFLGNKNARRVKVKIKGVIYESITEASKATGISQTHIARINQLKIKK